MKGGGGCRVISRGWGMSLVWLAKYLMSKKSSCFFLADNRCVSLHDGDKSFSGHINNVAMKWYETPSIVPLAAGILSSKFSTIT